MISMISYIQWFMNSSMEKISHKQIYHLIEYRLGAVLWLTAVIITFSHTGAFESRYSRKCPCDEFCLGQQEIPQVTLRTPISRPQAKLWSRDQ